MRLPLTGPRVCRPKIRRGWSNTCGPGIPTAKRARKSACTGICISSIPRRRKARSRGPGPRKIGYRRPQRPMPSCFRRSAACPRDSRSPPPNCTAAKWYRPACPAERSGLISTTGSLQPYRYRYGSASRAADSAIAARRFSRQAVDPPRLAAIPSSRSFTCFDLCVLAHALARSSPYFPPARRRPSEPGGTSKHRTNIGPRRARRPVCNRTTTRRAPTRTFLRAFI